MSHLTPQKRPDRNGKMVTRHVKTDTIPVVKAPIPAPTAPARTDTIPLTALKKLTMLLGSEDGSAYFDYIGRKPPEYREVIMTAIAGAQSDDERYAVLCVVDEASTPRVGTLALDDPSFLIELARQHTVLRASGSKVYSGAVMVMDQSFREHFRDIPIDEAGVRKYAPLLRAASITKTLGIDQNALTSFDKVDQMRHVNDNMDTFTRHLLACRSVTLHAGKDTMFNSEELLGICEVLDAHPGSDDILMKYVSDRKRYDPDEFKLVLSGASRSLSEGTL